LSSDFGVPKRQKSFCSRERNKNKPKGKAMEEAVYCLCPDKETFLRAKSRLFTCLIPMGFEVIESGNLELKVTEGGSKSILCAMKIALLSYNVEITEEKNHE
jgi:hypothetical protein